MEGLWLKGRVSGEEGGEISCEWCHGGMGVFGGVDLWEKLKLEGWGPWSSSCSYVRRCSSVLNIDAGGSVRGGRIGNLCPDHQEIPAGSGGC